MTSTTASPKGGEWLESWDPENEQTWDKGLAWKTLWITTFSLFLAFVAWFLPSALIPKLNPLGYSFTTTAAGSANSRTHSSAALLDGRHARLVGRPVPTAMDGRAANHGHPKDGRPDLAAPGLLNGWLGG